MKKVYVISAKRTPIGSFGGALSDIHAGKLASIAINAAMLSGNIPTNIVDEVIVGNVLSTGQGMGIGRQAAIYAGIPDSVPAYTLNMVCGSGMKSVMDAVSHIKSDSIEIVVAAGVEVMSQIPFITPYSIRKGHKMGDMRLIDLLISDGLTDVYNQCHMGITAENIASEMSISRQEQDEYALNSQLKSIKAIEVGVFKDEIISVDIQKFRKMITFDTDEYPKATATLSALQKLKPAFSEEGSVTAGNASGINDGASAIVLASEEAVKKHGLSPICQITSYAQSGIAPRIMGLAPVDAIAKALNAVNLNIEDMELYEINEAFAAQTLGVIYKLAEKYNVSSSSILEKTNVNGGAIALGHPLGASGNRILVTLIHELNRRNGRYGVASLCVGGGMGTAVVVEKIK
ncbi:acetyl-CoA acetyltransferase [Candidatus Photodesmus blepharus]|uniref:Acetyl-CoA acetyltransferase n=1 Tax=Candidatus Photodesmus blepharonis TaxID=1179155 RepID=A0A084CMZ4_9GAMM|nr:acetyl-CoA C-acetyltransferase [Candidatus Photodesmus blepharus]KEY91173.1 acetyl-CoA acetyltransferase [Candidatus Photodesmus blepharus]